MTTFSPMLKSGQEVHPAILKRRSGGIYNVCEAFLDLPRPGSDAKCFMRDTFALVYKDLKHGIFRRGRQHLAFYGQHPDGGEPMTDPVHYCLDAFPPKKIEWERLVPLIGKANAALARYDGLVAAIPDADVLLSPLTMQEAVLSSKIEGTIVTMGEALEFEAGGGTDLAQSKRDDAEEIINYRMALRCAADSLNDGRPLSLHLLREAHTLLMQGVRGHNKSPGAFRQQQNWIGPPNCSIDDARFVPIPQEHLLAGLERWSDYIQSGTERDPLVQLAIIHVEFEALHPFMDGNGRLGRMIVPLFLHERGILSGPNFYISGYLEAHREQYVEAMQAVSRDGNWTDWCLFFLAGLVEQAAENQAKADAILKLHQRMTHRVAEVTHSQFSGRAVEFLFSNPVFSTSHFLQSSGIPQETAHRILRVLRGDDVRVLHTLRKGRGRRPAIFVFAELLNIAEGQSVF